MQRYFIELAYKGTSYSGFQVQDNAGTIQEELQKALEVLFRQNFALTGSSRTDSGVHALQNYFHFDSELAIEPRSVYNLNAILPPDITVKGLFPVPAEAHCRFDAVSREYRYYIYGKKDPFMADRGWLYAYPLNISHLQAAADIVRMNTDFTSFAKRNSQVKTFMCTVMESQWMEEGERLVYRVRANRFLRGMVRGLVATMLKVGRGQITVGDFKEIIGSKSNMNTEFSAPSKGLFLTRVAYSGKLGEILGGMPVRNEGTA